jgi:hypothetical protein
MEKLQFLEIVVVILLFVNAILMNRTSRLKDELESVKLQTEVFLNDLGNRLKNVEREKK